MSDTCDFADATRGAHVNQSCKLYSQYISDKSTVDSVIYYLSSSGVDALQVLDVDWGVDDEGTEHEKKYPHPDSHVELCLLLFAESRRGMKRRGNDLGE
jgi:hypothetical protein